MPARKPSPADTRRMPLKLGALRPAVDLFCEEFAAAHDGERPSLHDAVLTLIRRGLRASPEMPPAED